MLLKIFGWIQIIGVILLAVLGMVFLHELFQYAQYTIYEDARTQAVIYAIVAFAAFLMILPGVFLIAIGDMKKKLGKIEKHTSDMLTQIKRAE